MRTIGLIGGMSWESSSQYYQIVNRSVREALGGVHSARCLLHSVDFGEVAPLQAAGEWDRLGAMLVAAGRSLKAGGADFLVLCTNTMHLLADRLESEAGLPLLHIVDPTARAIASAGYRRVGLLGTAFTMEKAFYRQRLADRFGIEAIVPDPADRAQVHRVIYEELVSGQVLPQSRADYVAIIARLQAAGAEAVILGCTEIMLLIGEDDSPLPLFDTTRLHARAAAEHALAG